MKYHKLRMIILISGYFFDKSYIRVKFSICYFLNFKIKPFCLNRVKI